MNWMHMAEITDNRAVARDVYRLSLALPADYPRPEPGQFVCLYLNDPSRLLPRPFGVCDWTPGRITLVYAVVGEGTGCLSCYEPGTAVRLSTPTGNGFPTEGFDSFVLVGGGVGLPPLLYLSKCLDVPVRAVLGFRSQPFLTGDFPCAVDVATDDGSVGFKGNVTDLLIQTGVPGGACICACGPGPMLRSLAGFAKERGLALRVSLEERMGCGYGACVGCVCKTKGGHRKVCADGPVFDADEVIWDD